MGLSQISFFTKYTLPLDVTVVVSDRAYSDRVLCAVQVFRRSTTKSRRCRLTESFQFTLHTRTRTHVTHAVVRLVASYIPVMLPSVALPALTDRGGIQFVPKINVCVASPSRRDAGFTYDLTTERISHYIL